MKLRALSSFLLRAPLLPVRAWRRSGEALREHPLGLEAVALASPALAAGLNRGGAAARQAFARYGRRAAFRPTPHGLLAGVAVGQLGPRTRIATGEPRAHRTVAWGRLAAVGRALLEDAETRVRVRLRVPPSLLVWAREAAWLALPLEGSLAARQVELDPPLAAVLIACEDWCDWPAARAAAARAFGDDGPADDEEIDEYLVMLVDQGALHVDVTPPLVGPPPLDWMRARLRQIDTAAAAEALAPIDDPAAATLATLLHGGQATLSRAVVERAATLAPLLFRLQQALAPPIAERALGAALLERLEGIAEIHGAGPYHLGALATGAHGSALTVVDEEPTSASSPEPALLGHLVELLAGAARAGDEEVILDPTTLEPLLPVEAPPPSFELVLTPNASPRGDGWLLGLHAPAGASWGRYAHAVGAPMHAALDELAAAEAGDEIVADISYAPSAALADLCAHPSARATALALVSWAERAVPVSALDLDIDPSVPLVLRQEGRSVRPSPLHRVRSTTAPPGIYRLLAGWSFVRQHAPWAFGWGALADLPRLPQVRLGGFVVAPASWRIPDAAALAGRGFARWRKDARVPRLVQIGEGDELLLVDLDESGAREDLRRHAGQRAHEVWPPLADLADRGGRRVEAVVAVIAEHEAPPARAAVLVDPQPQPRWTTFKLFGAADRQDQVLLALAPLVDELRRAGAVDRWHFLRYVDPGARDHLRLRVREPRGHSFARRLRAALAPLRLDGDVTAMETAEYFPEHARYGGAATFELVERIFEAESALVLQVLADEAETPPEGDRVETLVRGWEALARGLGLELAGRQALAARRRAAHLGAPDRELDADYRTRQRRLAALLSGRAEDALTAALAQFEAAVRAIVEPSSAVIDVLAPVLHLGAVRLLGARPDDEAAAYLYWERTLEGLAARARQGKGADPG